VADVAPGDSVVLAGGVKEVRFDYLLDPGEIPSVHDLAARAGVRATFVRE
jgi:hypothetical protein